MHKDSMAYGFYKFSRFELNGDGTVNIGPSYPNFQPPAEWSELLLALTFDKTLTVSSVANKRCGHLGVKTFDGKCYQCEMIRNKIASDCRKQVAAANADVADQLAALRATAAQAMDTYKDCQVKIKALMNRDHIASSRAEALQCGARWYWPTNECKWCGQIAPRYVANGTCRNCRNGRA